MKGQAMKEKYYHMFANGDDAKNFITSEDEFKAAMNRFAICGFQCGVQTVSASVEDSHPHALLWGGYPQCMKYAHMYEDLSLRCIRKRRGSEDGVKLHCELYEIDDEQYLKNVAVYTIIQATKDGKSIMPYDYKYGTGALYFRSKGAIMPWHIDENGIVRRPRPISDLTYREKRIICGSLTEVPDTWQVCNGFITPESYIDIRRFESIYKTHNCYRTFLGNNKYKDEEILQKMVDTRGVFLEDLEARRICGDLCEQLFHRSTTRMLSTDERILLAKTLRRTYHLSYRQLATLIKIPESELRVYVK